jgi:hypothetical protein
MNDTLLETASNWTNGFSSTYNKKYVKACSDCEKCKNKGMSREDTEEILLSRGNGEATVAKLLNEFFGESDAPKKNKVRVFIVPSSYDDIMPLMESRLASMGAVRFVHALTDSEQPIIKVSSRHKDRLLTLCKKVLSKTASMDVVHEEVKPYVEEAMLEAVLEAENNNATLEKTADGIYSVKFSNLKTASVDLNNGVSTSDTFVNGNYANFGIADAFMVKAHDELSPYSRMTKDMS